MKSEKEKMLAGECYEPADEILIKERASGRQLAREFNRSENPKEKKKILSKLFGTIGKQINVEPNIRVDYGGNVHVGENFYANFDCVFLDVCPIRIGKNAMFGPGVCLLTPEHPLDPEERNSGIEFGRPITIGDNCWIGGNATIIGGVTLGDNVVVAAGAVVTKSFGDNVVLAGVPARVVKDIQIDKE